MRAMQKAYIYAQIAAAVMLAIIAAGNALRSLAKDNGTIYAALFGVVAVVAIRLMLLPSIKELKRFRTKQ